MTSCFDTMEPMGRITHDVMQRRVPLLVKHQDNYYDEFIRMRHLGAKSAIYDCLV